MLQLGCVHGYFRGKDPDFGEEALVDGRGGANGDDGEAEGE